MLQLRGLETQDCVANDGELQQLVAHSSAGGKGSRFVFPLQLNIQAPTQLVQGAALSLEREVAGRLRSGSQPSAGAQSEGKKAWMLVHLPTN